ncbi:hypothetical protein [Celerinatantimonas diazotrophica]|uniref:Uncharacterized protein n=1 Tax=Celerinatantimonas diazotrophica TaxID=412034 RepID=A0A4R1JLW7_9GAMM|nr:hypothetical protein [Celerinatantimonas diazotrophica]TCK52065.1 hypothetical protein EV690_2165 [Celerinatantimonas diazotrophica]CAG9296232.1 hypothetical protein CEDIAZO_01380 [Celerinatantimonas diazotrophica]
MDTHEIITQIKTRIANGERKTEVFEQLRDQGMRENRVAFLIAGTPTPEQLKNNRTLKIALVTLLIVLTIPLAYLAHYFVTHIEYQRGVLVGFFTVSVGIFCPLVCAFGIYRNRFAAYTNVLICGIFYIIFPLMVLHTNGLPLTLPGVGLLALAIILLAYCGYVRTRMFPALSLTGSVKKNQHNEYKFD